MASFTVAVLAIALERAMVVASALVAIVLGWNLFTRAIIPNQSGSFSFGDWKVELKTVGPGVFFSLFGTIVLVYVLLKPAQYSTNTASGPASSVTTISALGMDQAEDNITLSYVRAINTIAEIQKIAAQPATPAAPLLPAQINDLGTAAGLLAQLRQHILVGKFGMPLVDEWAKYGQTYQTDKQSLPLNVKSDLDQIAPWFTQTVTDQPPSPQ